MTTLTVMTWNVQNFFLAGHARGPDSRATFRAKLTSLASVINFVKPTVLALQEVGELSSVVALQAALRHRLPCATTGRPDHRGSRVAILSTERLNEVFHLEQFPISNHPTSSSNDNTNGKEKSGKPKLGRGALHVNILVEGKPVSIITAHFKSKLNSNAQQQRFNSPTGPQSCNEEERYRYAAKALNRRTAEAITVRKHLNQMLTHPNKPGGNGHETPIIFCGALNDCTDAATTQIIQGPTGSEIDTADFGKPDKGDGYRLWNLAPLLPDIAGRPAYTRQYKGRPELIDHIFATRALVNPQCLPIADTTCNPNPLPNIGDNPNSRKNQVGSDHAAVFATFTF